MRHPRLYYLKDSAPLLFRTRAPEPWISIDKLAEGDYVIRVLIVDDHKLVREGFQLLLGRAKDIEVVAEARDGQEAVEIAERLAPDVVLMDITMPRMNGIQATKLIRERCSKTQVIVVSMVSDEILLSQAQASGAKGYISKNDCFDRLVSEIRSVCSQSNPQEG